MSLLRRIEGVDRNQLLRQLLEKLTESDESRAWFHSLLDAILKEQNLTVEQVGEGIYIAPADNFVAAIAGIGNHYHLRVLRALLEKLAASDESRTHFHAALDSALQAQNRTKTQVQNSDSLYNDPASFFTPTNQPTVELSPRLREIQTKVIAFIESVASNPEIHQSDIEDFFNQQCSELAPPLTRAEKQRLFYRIFSKVFGLGVLEELLDDEHVTEIIVNGATQIDVRQRSGVLTRSPLAFDDENALLTVIDRILAQHGDQADPDNPLYSGRLADGSDVTIIKRPVSLGGPVLHIKKLRRKRIKADDLVKWGTITAEAIDFLKFAVKADLNLIVAGPPGGGKTGLLQGLGEYLLNDDLIVDVARFHELQLEQEHVILLQRRPATAGSEITEAQLVDQALHLRPNRLIVEELVGAELFALAEAWVSFMGTTVATSMDDALDRLVRMCQMGKPTLPEPAIRNLLAHSVDLIVFVEQRRTGSRKVISIVEMNPDFTVTPLWEFDDFTLKVEVPHLEGLLRRTSVVPRCLDRLVVAGLDRDKFFQKSALDSDVT